VDGNHWAGLCAWDAHYADQRQPRTPLGLKAGLVMHGHQGSRFDLRFSTSGKIRRRRMEFFQH
jgi:hypothetical protein